MQRRESDSNVRDDPKRCSWGHMDRPNEILTQTDADALKRREAREIKPVREWTVAERCEAFNEVRRIERERAEAGIVDEWELWETCHDYKRERGLSSCNGCIEQMRRYED